MKSFIFMIAVSALVIASAIPLPNEEIETKQFDALGNMAGSLMPTTPSTLGIGMQVASAVVSALSTGNPIEDAQRLYKLYKAYEAITNFMHTINPMTYLPSSSQAMADIENLTSNFPSIPSDISSMIPALPSLPTGRQLFKLSARQIPQTRNILSLFSQLQTLPPNQQYTYYNYSPSVTLFPLGRQLWSPQNSAPQFPQLQQLLSLFNRTQVAPSAANNYNSENYYSLYNIQSPFGRQLSSSKNFLQQFPQLQQLLSLFNQTQIAPSAANNYNYENYNSLYSIQSPFKIPSLTLFPSGRQLSSPKNFLAQFPQLLQFLSLFNRTQIAPSAANNYNSENIYSLYNIQSPFGRQLSTPSINIPQSKGEGQTPETKFIPLPIFPLLENETFRKIICLLDSLNPFNNQKIDFCFNDDEDEEAPEEATPEEGEEGEVPADGEEGEEGEVPADGEEGATEETADGGDDAAGDGDDTEADGDDAGDAAPADEDDAPAEETRML